MQVKVTQMVRLQRDVPRPDGDIDIEMDIRQEPNKDDMAVLTRAGWYVSKRWNDCEPATMISYGFNGHKYEYDIIGAYADGTPQTQQFSARHQDDCPCYTSEEGPWPEEDW